MVGHRTMCLQKGLDDESIAQWVISLRCVRHFVFHKKTANLEKLPIGREGEALTRNQVSACSFAGTASGGNFSAASMKASFFSADFGQRPGDRFSDGFLGIFLKKSLEIWHGLLSTLAETGKGADGSDPHMGLGLAH